MDVVEDFWGTLAVRRLLASGMTELIPTVKMETRRRFVMHFRRSIIVAELWRPKSQDVEIFFDIFAFFKRLLTGQFSKFCSESFHRDTDRRVVLKFREI